MTKVVARATNKGDLHAQHRTREYVAQAMCLVALHTSLVKLKNLKRRVGCAADQRSDRQWRTHLGHAFEYTCATSDIEHRTTKPRHPRSSREDEPNHQGLTPYEFICKAWASQLERFTFDPFHQMPGLNI
jgi:hypothetical protein